MPSIEIKEQDLTTGGGSATNLNVVYVPGFVNHNSDAWSEDATPAAPKTPTLCKSVAEFEKYFGKKPAVFSTGTKTEGDRTVTIENVDKSYLYVIKKPVRIGITEENTKYSHFIHFTYVVDGNPYQGKLFITPYYRCPGKGETIEVYYDPEKPQDYACYAFGPGISSTGW